LSAIPGEVARPIIQEYLDNYKTYGYDNYPVGSPEYMAAPGALMLLAKRAGVEQNTLYKFMAGITQSINFYHFDRIVSAMGNPLKIWLEEPFASFYYSADLDEAPPA
jgi:hypothetical protein